MALHLSRRLGQRIIIITPDGKRLALRLVRQGRDGYRLAPQLAEAPRPTKATQATALILETPAGRGIAAVHPKRGQDAAVTIHAPADWKIYREEIAPEATHEIKDDAPCNHTTPSS
jgi:sRNA-binding carbon storage regulator CsrA